MAGEANKTSFKEKLRSGRVVVGTFLKTPHPIVAEVLSRTL
jgi:2,4-dihydroxyhept-2-ene-1,7-dioic acid aldolase